MPILYPTSSGAKAIGGIRHSETRPGGLLHTPAGGAPAWSAPPKGSSPSIRSVSPAGPHSPAHRPLNECSFGYGLGD